MSEWHQRIIAKAVGRAPEFIRRELLSREPSVRRRAEDALVGLIAHALANAAVKLDPDRSDATTPHGQIT